MNSNNEQTLVYCGNNCMLCPRLNDNSCGGCMTDNVVEYCQKCETRLCCQERKLENCAQCSEYPCMKVNELYAKWTISGYGAGAVICRERLDKIKKSADEIINKRG